MNQLKISEKILLQAKKIQPDLIKMRRFLHKNAEIGFDVPLTKKYVKEKLKEFGLSPKNCGKAGVVASVGKKSRRAFLLRADIDALPIREETGLSFACKTGNMHACGHDMHTAMLLGAAKLLKEKEDALQNEIRFLFQPAEELLQGASDAIDAGILKNPTIAGALTLHVMTDTPFKNGSVFIPKKGVGAPAADYFTIAVQGKGCHGSTPYKGVDALSVGAHILLALQAISAREFPSGTGAVLTVGKFIAGDVANVIADTALLQGTLRTFDEELRTHIKSRISETAKEIAVAFGATAQTTFDSGCPSLLNDGKMTAFAVEKLPTLLDAELVVDAATLNADARAGGSEDFAYISREVPSLLLGIAAGQQEKGYAYPLHHPKVRFDEDALYYGCATYVFYATEYLKNQ